MAQGKGRPGLLIYHDELEVLEMMLHNVDNQEFADLIVAAYHYSAFGEVPSFEGRSERFIRLFKRIATKVDAQEEAYRRKVEGAKKGGSAKARKDRAENVAENGVDEAMRDIMTQSVHVGFTGMKTDEKELIQAELREGYSVRQIVEAMRKTAAASGVKDRKAYFTHTLHNP